MLFGGCGSNPASSSVSPSPTSVSPSSGFLPEALGATGITVAKIGEAEALVDAGVYDDFFIANEIVGPIKHRRLLALMERAEVRVAVDTVDVARGLNEANLRAMVVEPSHLRLGVDAPTARGDAGARPVDLLRSGKRPPLTGGGSAAVAADAGMGGAGNGGR